MNTSTNSLPSAVPSAIVPIVRHSAPATSARLFGVHPAASLFPLMQGTDLGLLVEDISQNGLREPIVLYDGLILDGRNRLRACELAQVEPHFVEWNEDGSPLAFVLSRNLHRRHLNESQRSIIAARAKGMFEEEAAEREHAHQFGSPMKNPSDELGDEQKSRIPAGGANLHRPERSNSQAAALLNVSARSVATASRVLADGDQQLIAAVDAGEIAVSDAATVVELTKGEQRQALEQVRSGGARTLRQAAEVMVHSSHVSGPAVTPGPDAADADDEPKPCRRDLRRACKRFAADYEKMCNHVIAAALASGGPNDYTQRARDGLAVALRAMQDCVNHFGRRTK